MILEESEAQVWSRGLLDSVLALCGQGLGQGSSSPGFLFPTR